MISAHQLPAESESSRGREKKEKNDREREIQREMEIECGKGFGGKRFAAVLRKCATATVASVTV